MAIHKGSDGVVKVGSSTIAEVMEWSLNEQSDPQKQLIWQQLRELMFLANPLQAVLFRAILTRETPPGRAL